MLHETTGTAYVQMEVVLRVGQNLTGIQGGFGLLIEVQEQAVGKRCGTDPFDKGCALAGAGAVVQFKVSADVSQAFSHAQNRGDADAAGKQQAAPGAVGERKQVAWLADTQLCTTVDVFMQAARSAS
ncbi:hypothetical protein D3C77_650430 [compost metagenome]